VRELVGDTYYVAVRTAGPAWDASRAMREQERWDDHAAFMDGLAAEGWIVLGGPLGDGRRALHIVAAAGAEEVKERLAADPWAELDVLRLESVERWQILLRAGR
jgi:uncharacterized protein YciI